MFMTRCSRTEQPLPRFVKRTMDIVAAGLAILALGPIMMILAALVKKDGGPIFYADRRNFQGLNGVRLQQFIKTTGLNQWWK